MTLRSLAALARVACLATLVGLAACGGGGGEGGVGSGGTGAPVTALATGTVTGFGSLFVDGVRYDDRLAVPVSETAPGQETRVEVQLGDRVELGLDDAGAARTVRVEPALRGPVSSVGPTGFVVLGQTVSVVTDANQGPVTQFTPPYTALADVRPGDNVQVHGVVVPQAGSPSAVQATRVGREDTAPAVLRLTGIVRNRTATTFDLGTFTLSTAGAAVLPQGATLADGQVVRVLLPATQASSVPAAASQVRIHTPGAAGQRGQVAGTVASLDATGHTFLVGAQRVDYAAAVPATPLAAGQYVRVRGQFAADGTLVATDVTLRTARGAEPESALVGNIGSLGNGTFVVRGVRVQYSLTGSTRFVGCGAATPPAFANGQFVEVEGSLVPSGGVSASTITCESESAGAVVERAGIANQVSVSGRTLELTTTDGATVSVRWSDATLFVAFGNITVGNGLQLQVEGVFDGTTLVARKIRLVR